MKMVIVRLGRSVTELSCALVLLCKHLPWKRLNSLEIESITNVDLATGISTLFILSFALSVPATATGTEQPRFKESPRQHSWIASLATSVDSFRE